MRKWQNRRRPGESMSEFLRRTTEERWEEDPALNSAGGGPGWDDEDGDGESC